MNSSSIFSMFGILLIVILIPAGIALVWVPDLIQNEGLLKVIMTLGILMIGTLAISGINTMLSASKKDTKNTEDPKE